jgi:hypothetical protein
MASLRAEKKTPETRFLSLKRLIFSKTAAGLILVVWVGIWQFNFHEEPSTAGMVANEIRCNVLNVVVHSPIRTDALIACAAAREAIEFLSSQGMDVSGDIAIELLKKLPPVECSSAAGCYIELERRALILVYSEFIKFKTWFDVPIDRALYRSLVSHEVAHLVADLNFKIPKPSIQAKEYIAYITQFSIMEPLQRERVLTQYPCEAFEGDWEMSTTIYMFDCMRFGVRAYLHFLNLANRREYLQSILNGKTLVE